jgi:hypothetical protein
MLPEFQILGLTNSGEPRHPLFMHSRVTPIRWRAQRADSPRAESRVEASTSSRPPYCMWYFLCSSEHHRPRFRG